MEALQVIFESGMDSDPMWDVCEERMPTFRKVPGLVQKVYLWDDETEKISGLYLFEDEARLEEFLDSDLRASIPDAYDIQGKPELRRWSVPGTLFPLGQEPVSASAGEAAE